MDIQDLIKKAEGNEYIRVNMNTERDVNNFVEFCNKTPIRWLNDKKPIHGNSTQDGGVRVGIALFINVNYIKRKNFHCISFANVEYDEKDAILIPSESLLPYRNIKRGLL